MPASFHPSPGEPTARLDRRVVERPVQQAHVLVSYLGPLLTDPDYAALRVLGTVHHIEAYKREWLNPLA